MPSLATHSGTFHADDVFAFAILRAAHGGDVTLTRSRDKAELEQADIVFDVGGLYDPARHRYDHHMRDKPLRPDGQPYSSAGLVWREFGASAAQNLLDRCGVPQIGRLVAMVDSGLIRDVDLMDNGAMPATPGHFSTVIEAFNATFAEPDRDENAAFFQAVELAAAVLTRTCAHAAAVLQAEAQMAQAAQAAHDPRIIVLDQRIPWEDAIFDLNLTQALYVVRPAGEAWTCSAVPPERGSFAQRLPLPDAWGGLRDQALAGVTGVADATFCHPARFVCGALSRDGAVALARLAADHTA